MRLRLVIPAVMAGLATYAALMRDAQTAATTPPAPAPPAPRPAAPPVERSPMPAAADPTSAPARPPAPPAARPAPSVFQDLAPSPVPPGPTILDILAGAPPAEAHEPAGSGTPQSPGPVAQAGPAAELAPLEEGRFALGGWAAAAGHSVVSAVTYRRRLPAPAAADRIVLEIDASDNVPEGGLVVLSDPGFAPDRDGFTILLAAEDPGPFSAAGSYRVLPTP